MIVDKDFTGEEELEIAEILDEIADEMIKDRPGDWIVLKDVCFLGYLIIFVLFPHLNRIMNI